MEYIPACIHYGSEKVIEAPNPNHNPNPNPNPNPKRRVTGIDPGRVDMIFGVEKYHKYVPYAGIFYYWDR